VAWLILLSKLGTMVFVAYLISSRSRITGRGMVAFVLAIGGTLAFFAGMSLAVMEEARAREGRVVSGVVIEKLSSTGQNGSREIGPWGGRNQARRMNVVTGKGFQFYDTIVRLVLTGAASAWVIDYRYPCDGGPACFDRDFVTKDQWLNLRSGQPVNILRAPGESGSSRLDGNSHWGTAIVRLATAATLLLSAGFVSGRLVLFRRSKWITAPATVTAVEPVKYRDVVRWRIRFAYFDREGVPQESADEVVTGTWKPGDQCLAVFQSGQPDLATMKPVSD
jgi:hypothetical protein